MSQIVDAGVLGTSERRAELLRYLVDKELSGTGNEIKAFSIAVDVLGRDASFDPNTDSIVRSEIGRLRDALRLYNAEHAGPGDLRIEIPKGSYRPALSRPVEAEPRPAVPINRVAALFATGLVAVTVAVFAMQWFKQPPVIDQTDAVADTSGQPYEFVRIAVHKPEVHSDNPNAEKIAIGLTAELMMDLSAYPWLSIIAPVDGLDGIDSDAIDYVLDAELYWGEDALEAQTKLVSYPEEELIWSSSQTVDLEANAIRETIVEMASRVAFRIGSRQGIAPELTRVKNAHRSPENLEAYLCYLGLHRYFDRPSEETHLELRNCLLEAVRDFPEFGDAWGALAIVYIDEARFRQNPREDADPWVDAEAAIEKALLYSPLRMLALNVALIESAEAPVRDAVEFDRVSSLLLNLFPKHPTTLYNVGSRSAEFMGKWDAGIALVDQAIELNPDPPSVYYLTRAYKAALDGSDAEALETTKPLVNTGAVSQLLLNYLAALRNTQTEAMQRFGTLLAKNGLSNYDALVAHVKGRRYDPPLEAALLEQLEEAKATGMLQ